MGFRQPTELRQAGAPAHRLHRPRTAHRHAVRRAPGRRREHPCAARTADGGLPAGGGLAALAAGGEDGRDRPGPAWLSRRRQHPALAGRQRARLSAPRRQPRGRLVSG
ncbi:two-component sensor, partial [Pseudomonas aeruginosa ATCC 700888]